MNDPYRTGDSLTPHPSRLPADHPFYEEIIQRHTAACDDGAMGYIDPVSGLFAMTAIYLASRPCCDRGCRHCPYIGVDDFPHGDS